MRGRIGENHAPLRHEPCPDLGVHRLWIASHEEGEVVVPLLRRGVGLEEVELDALVGHERLPPRLGLLLSRRGVDLSVGVIPHSLESRKG